MYIKPGISTALALLSAVSLLPVATACGPIPRANNDTGYPKISVGGEGSDPDTTAYNLNHVSLNVRNLTRSLDFYTGVFGFRHMFTVQFTEHAYIAYMGHSSGGKNGTGYQTTEELIAQQHNSQGLLELLYVDVGEDGNEGDMPPSSTEKPNTFSHLGVIVPDIEKTQKRLEDMDVTMYKKINEPWPQDGPALNAFAGVGDRLSEAEFQQGLGFLSELNKLTIFAGDPDGNMLEVMPSEGSAVIF